MDNANPPKKRIAFPTLNGWELFDIDKIIYIAAENSQCSVFIVGREGAIVVNKSLKEFEEELADNDFVRIHRSYLVNYNHILKYIKGKGGIVIMSNYHEVDVSNGLKEDLLKKMEWPGRHKEHSTADSSDSPSDKAALQVGA